MDPNSQVLLSISIPTIAVLVGILINNAQLTSLRNEVAARFEVVNTRFENVDRRFESLERQLDARFNEMYQSLKACLTLA
jgi:uncharacterized membrane-anchored protein YhcB (DUF1043 family)